MATAYAVLDRFQSIIAAALADLTVNETAISVGVGQGWPGVSQIQACAAQPAAVIGIFEKSSDMIVRFWPRRFLTTKNSTGIGTALSKIIVNPSGTATLTLDLAVGSSQVNVSDAVAIIVDAGITRYGAVVSASNTDTLATLATGLAAAINATAGLDSLVSAAASGAVITLTNLSQGVVKLSSNVGNVGTIYKEVARSCMETQIVCYSGSWNIRRAISDILEVQLGTLRGNYGFTITEPNQESVQVTRASRFDIPNDKDTPANLYRQDFFVSLEYGITSTEEAYSVLVPNAKFQLF